jgi:signal transduction histidine kinase
MRRAGTAASVPPVRIARRDLLPALALFGTGSYEVWAGPLFGGVEGPRVVNAVVVALITLPLLARRHRPVAVFAVVSTASIAQHKLASGAWLVPADEGMAQTWFATLVAWWSLAAHAPPRHAAIAGLAGGAAFVGNDVSVLLAGRTTLDHTLPAWFILAGAWGVGFALRGRQLEVDALAAEREAVAAAERERIARELHDVVAHSLSVMVVQAQAAQRVLEGEQASAREALAAVDATGRQALVEMRRLVGMLRERGDEGLAPQPGLDQLDVLLDQVRAAGLPVDLRVEGARRPLAPGVDLAAYRIVQEALTNVLRHAGPARAAVVLRFGADAVELEVVDDGAGANGSVGGHGLAGMRERVTIFGGRLESGSVDGRGFRVRAQLPA